MCADLEESDLEPLEAFAEWARFALTGDECFDSSFASEIAIRTNPAWDQPGTLSGSNAKTNPPENESDTKPDFSIIQDANGTTFNAHKPVCSR